MRQVMIVTGGSQGIGEAVARLAAERGYAVALTYQSNKALADAVVADIQAAGGTGHRDPRRDGRRGLDHRALPNSR